MLFVVKNWRCPSIGRIKRPHSLGRVGRAGTDGLLHRQYGDVAIEKEIVEVVALDFIKRQSLIDVIIGIRLITLAPSLGIVTEIRWSYGDGRPDIPAHVVAGRL